MYYLLATLVFNFKDTYEFLILRKLIEVKLFKLLLVSKIDLMVDQKCYNGFIIFWNGQLFLYF